jgi:hypothetical protein
MRSNLLNDSLVGRFQVVLWHCLWAVGHGSDEENQIAEYSQSIHLVSDA